MPEYETTWTSDLLQAPHNVTDKSKRVRRMFNAIAPRYELVNSLFSAGRDTAWRRHAVKLARVRPDDDVLDIACGTGDFVRAFAVANPRSIIGTDFAHDMLIRAANETVTTTWCEADALNLPFGDGHFSITSCAFGVRNFQNLQAGLSEMFRVLRPGGRAVVLEFTRPTNRIARSIYEFYTHRIMPPAASWISGDKSGAYRYLPRSVVSFPSAEQMCSALQEAGFDHTTATPMTLGVVTVYIATRNI